MQGDRLASGAKSAKFPQHTEEKEQPGPGMKVVETGAQEKSFECKCGAKFPTSAEFVDHIHGDCPL